MKPRHQLPGGTRRHVWGWKRDIPDVRDDKFRFVARTMDLTTGRGVIPPVCDLADHWPDIQDQYELGACTAFASVAAIRYLYRKEGKNPPDLSELFTYYYTRIFEGTPPAEDSGAQIRTTMKVHSQMGVPKEAAWPYDVRKFSVEPPEPARVEAQKHKVLAYRRCYGSSPSQFLQAIKQAIAEGFPVVGGISVPANMMSDECARTGLIKSRKPEEELLGGHAIPFAGYCDEGAKHSWIPAGHLAIPNSWSKRWGRDGWCFLPYSYVFEKHVADCWVIIHEEKFD